MTVRAQADATREEEPEVQAVMDQHSVPRVAWSDGREVETFDAVVRRFCRGEIAPDEFKRFRLQHGVYGQRQDRMHMVRVKVPWGGLTTRQLLGLADVAERTASGTAHVTTRQNLQFYSLPPEDLAEAFRRLADIGLTTREACGNTVRNVVACAHAGVAPEEPFDVTPYADATARFFLRNPMNQNLPRKFKISFSGCSDHCGLAPIQDIGAVAAIQEDGGSRRRGFRLYVGGGLGASPDVAQLLEPFTPAEDLLLTLVAVVRVFDRTGNRENRNLARLKFVIRKIGIESFRGLVEKERSSLRWALAGKLPPIVVQPDPERPAPAIDPELPLDQPDFRRWWRTNVRPQKQPGYSMVSVRLPLGDITAQKLRVLAFASGEFADGWARTTNQQNVLLRWVPSVRLPDLFRVLRAAGLADPGAERLADITACAGRDTCQIGITSSRGLAAAIAKLIEERYPDLADDPDLRIRISGCPNSCGHHHLAAIGFSGGAREYEGQQVPTYQVYLGAVLRLDQTTYARPFVKVPAKNAPALVERLLELYRKERVNGERFESVAERLGQAALREAVGDLAELPPRADAPEAYKDWGEEGAFQVKMGESECAS